MKQLGLRQLELHIPVVAWLMILGHAMFLIGAIFLFVLLAGIGVTTGDRTALAILSLIGTTLAAGMAVLAAPGLAAGFGLLAHKAWARVLATALAVLGLGGFPIGTLVGIYTVWVMVQDAAGDYFGAAWRERRSQASAPQPA